MTPSASGGAGYQASPASDLPVPFLVWYSSASRFAGFVGRWRHHLTSRTLTEFEFQEIGPT